MQKKNYNGLLILGVCAIIIGLSLLIYSIVSYSEIKLVTDKIDFDSLDNNNQISTSDKYYKYLSIWDSLNQKLEKNKNLPIKNMSCAYLDYAQHNVKSLYTLIYKKSNEDTSRRLVVEGNVKSLIDMYKNYKNCRKTEQYSKELNNILNEIRNSDDVSYQGRMETFLNGERYIERASDANAGIEIIKDDSYDQYEPQITPALPRNNENSVSQSEVPSANSASDDKYKQVEKYIESQNQ